MELSSDLLKFIQCLNETQFRYLTENVAIDFHYASARRESFDGKHLKRLIGG